MRSQQLHRTTASSIRAAPTLARIGTRAVLALLIATALAACDSVLGLDDGTGGAPAAGGVTDHVIVVSIDGLRPDAIDAFGARTLQRLVQEGSSSLEAHTILPSRTLPAHTSMLTGTEPDVHGVTWNDERVAERGFVAAPTIFATARAAGHHTAAFFSKSKFLHLVVPGTLDYARLPGGSDSWSADRTVDLAESYLDDNRPNLLFVHIGEPDYVGHAAGWMSAAYGFAVREADDELDELLQTADRAFGAGNYTVIVTADHGGHDHTHGSADPRDVNIPWIVWGEGVRPGTVLPSGIRTTDTAATALWLLGVAAPDAAVGQAVLSAFAATVAPASM